MLKMEFNFDDTQDAEWLRLVNSYIEKFISSTKDQETSLDQILQRIFSTGTNTDQEPKHKDKEIWEKCLTESLNLIFRRPNPPRSSQTWLVLTIAKYALKDETSFINLNINNTIQNLVYLSKSCTDLTIKVLLIEMLHSLLDHASGVKWLTESKSWSEAYMVTLKCHSVDDNVTQLGIQCLTKLLESVVKINENYCSEVIKVITAPLSQAVVQIEVSQNPETVVEKLQLHAVLLPTATCIIAILERLLKTRNENVLRAISPLKTYDMTDTISKASHNSNLCFLMDRITIILSFFGLTEAFDGIHIVNHDPLVLSGFVRMIDRAVNKSFVREVLDLYYYALKYCSFLKEKLPKYNYKGRLLDIEMELIMLQIEPIVLMWEKLNVHVNVLADSSFQRMLHLTKIFKHISYDSFRVGYKIKRDLPAYPFQVYTLAVEHVIRSKDLYCKENVGIVFECLVYSLEDTLKHVKQKKEYEQIGPRRQRLFLTVIRALSIFIEDLNWPDSLKTLDLPHLMHETLTVVQWPKEIIIEALKLLQESIMRRWSPSMSLLIDTTDGLQGIGNMLYTKYFTNEWEVRKAALDVVHAIALSANKSFSSFKTLLNKASLPQLVSTVALNDVNFSVRASALKCLQEMIVMEELEGCPSKSSLIDDTLEMLMTDADSLVKKEVIKLLVIAYTADVLESEVKTKAFKYLEHVTIFNQDVELQMQAIQFWRCVTKMFMSNQGWRWVEKDFPAVIFSKKIVCMTNKEINKRVYAALGDLSGVGCLSTFEKLWKSQNIHPDIKAEAEDILRKFYLIFKRYQINVETVSKNEDFLDLSTLCLSSQLPSESDQIIQEIINDTVLRMIPEANALTTDNLTSLSTPSTQPIPEVQRRITPSEFVELVLTLCSSKDKTAATKEKKLPLQQDFYNIIDY